MVVEVGGPYGGNGGHGQKKKYYRYPQEQPQHTPPQHTPPQHTPPQQQQMIYNVSGSQQRYIRKPQQQGMRNNNRHYNDGVNYNDHYVDGYGDY